MPRSQREGLLFILLAAIGYAFLPVLAKSVYADAVLQPIDVLTWRFIFATPMVWGAMRVLRQPKPVKPVPRMTMIGLGVLFAVVAGCAFFALERIPASLYTALLYTYPAIVTVLSMFSGERLPMRGWFALALTLVGVILTVPQLGGEQAVDGVGILLAVANATLYAVYLVISARVLRGHSAAAYASAWAITGSLLAMLMVMPFRSVAVPTLPDAWLGLAALALICTVVPSFSMLAGISRLGASRAAILSTTEPVMTVLLAMILLDEQMAPIQLFGGLLILASVVILESRAGAKPAAAAA